MYLLKDAVPVLGIYCVSLHLQLTIYVSFLLKIATNLPFNRGKAFAAKIARGWLLPMGMWRFLGVAFPQREGVLRMFGCGSLGGYLKFVGM